MSSDDLTLEDMNKIIICDLLEGQQK